jgi:hypothetical protein
MRTLTTLTMMLTLTATSGPALVAQVAEVRATQAASKPRSVETFAKTPEGDWKTVIKTADGREMEYLYVPPTKIAPSVRTRVSLVGSGGNLRVSYQYQIVNEPSAKQELARLFIGSVQAVAVSDVPSGWEQNLPQRPGNVSLRGPLTGDVPAGVKPGDAVNGPTLDGQVLPGVVTIRAMGNTAGAVSVPPGLSTKQYEELSAISRDTTVNVPAVGPAIAAGLGEPELTFDVVLVRVGAHYTSEFEKHKHPFASEVGSLFAGIAKEGASPDQAGVKSGLMKLKALSVRPVTTAWHRELSDALGVCVEALMSGAVPFRAQLAAPKDHD